MVTRLHVSTAIIGGGFCGTMLMVQLAKQAGSRIDIILFNTANPLARGTAFSSYSEEHLLNVAAKNMSAFPDNPWHFVHWLKKKKDFSGMSQEEIGAKFVARNLYGSYLEDIYNETKEKLAGKAKCNFINSEIISIVSDEKKYLLTATDGSEWIADKVVLASGNQLPRSIFESQHPLNQSPHYFSNPWSPESIKEITGDKPVLIVGTGLTMIDVVIGMTENKFQGRILSVSPKGFHMLPHRPHTPYSEILEEIKPPYELGELFKIFRKHVLKVKAENKSGETVVDALRSRTQEIWQSLSLRDRKRFMTHVRHLWGVARHRLPLSVYEKIQQLIHDGRLEILAGRIKEAHCNTDHVKVHIQNRKDQQIQIRNVQRVINCTGPEADPAKFNSTLFRQLLKDKLICVDEMQLGVKATAEGRTITQTGEISENFFVIGSLLRGTLWETTAVPELRIQAESIARLILEK